MAADIAGITSRRFFDSDNVRVRIKLIRPRECWMKGWSDFVKNLQVELSSIF